tara:strand:+ start:230 stop:445 length:216 start_codon:yes stop_codon:yes gene_type:complete
MIHRGEIMDNLKEEYQKNYINVLAKLGETELIINLHVSMKDDLLAEAEKMRDVLSAYNDNGVAVESEPGEE